ncbi:oligoendopeptidase F [Bacillus salacetis]|uniref:Oligoendopeptidase F n=2 Tax=Bacillus salacetis TaxID=2315464 RepID=A0A3A1R7W5_9BACI|nr:oligoendopeptidase F [Bacillus salacetis]
MKSLDLSIKELHSDLESKLENQEFSVSCLVETFRSIQAVMDGTFQADEFLICFSSDNVEDQSAAGMINKSARLRSDLEILLGTFDRLLMEIPQDVWTSLIKDEEVTQYRFFLEERKQRADDKLPAQLEKLIRNLSVNGFTAWEDHYDQQIAKLRVKVEQDGEIKNMTVGDAFFEVLSSSDRSYKQKVMKAYEEACEENADTYASIINHISGFRLDVYEQRGWDNVLKEALEQNRIEQASLNAMMRAIDSNQEAFHRFLKRKAELLKVDKLEWFDIPDNTFSTEKKVSYEEAVTIIVNQFRDFSENLGNLAEKAFKERWIEADDRSNKANGAFCASIPLEKESRILMTFRGNYLDVITLAHELGHAYHNYILDEEPAFSREKGTSVAETASTFCENLVLDSAMSKAENKSEKLSLLESKISAGLSYLSMIPSRFRFEQKFYEKRKEGLVSAIEITDLTAEAEREGYGEYVDGVHKHSWITTSHFYSTEKAFYNIPYTIGYLFSNGVYSLAKKEGKSFSSRYDELLRNSGRMTVEQLAETYLNADLHEEAFWQAAIQPVVEAIEEYIELTEELI